jgi:hypothetical protein
MQHDEFQTHRLLLETLPYKATNSVGLSLFIYLTLLASTCQFRLSEQSNTAKQM